MSTKNYLQSLKLSAKLQKIENFLSTNFGILEDSYSATLQNTKQKCKINQEEISLVDELEEKNRKKARKLHSKLINTKLETLKISKSKKECKNLHLHNLNLSLTEDCLKSCLLCQKTMDAICKINLKNKETNMEHKITEEVCFKKPADVKISSSSPKTKESKTENMETKNTLNSVVIKDEDVFLFKRIELWKRYGNPWINELYEITDNSVRENWEKRRTEEGEKKEGFWNIWKIPEILPKPQN